MTLVDELNSTFKILQHNSRRAIVKNRTEPLFALPQGFFGALAFGYVANYKKIGGFTLPMNARNREFNRKFGPVETEQLPFLYVDIRSIGHILPPIPHMRQSTGRDQAIHRHAD